MQGMPIAVDAFCYGVIPGVTSYFLTYVRLLIGYMLNHLTPLRLSKACTFRPLYEPFVYLARRADILLR